MHGSQTRKTGQNHGHSHMFRQILTRLLSLNIGKKIAKDKKFCHDVENHVTSNHIRLCHNSQVSSPSTTRDRSVSTNYDEQLVRISLLTWCSKLLEQHCYRSTHPETRKLQHVCSRLVTLMSSSRCQDALAIACSGLMITSLLQVVNRLAAS